MSVIYFMYLIEYLLYLCYKVEMKKIKLHNVNL